MCNGTCEYGLEDRNGNCTLSNFADVPCECEDCLSEEDCKEILAEERADSAKSRI